MNKRIMIALATVVLTATASLADVKGSWTAEKKKNGKIQLEMKYSRNSNTGQSYELRELQGLTAAQLSAGSETPVNFVMKREAGVITFTGAFEDGEGDGNFTFAPDRGFESRMRSLGVEGDDDELSDRELFHMALFDVSTQYVTDLKGVGFKDLDMGELVGARIHGVTADEVREYRALGIDDLDLGDAMALNIHGATPEYVSEMRKLGFRLDDSGDLVAFRIHGVTPAYINSMREVGYTKLDSDDFVAMKIHGVSPEFVRELKQLGYDDVDGDDLVAMKIHGVSADFIRQQNAESGEKLSIDELVEERIMGHHKHGKKRRG